MAITTPKIGTSEDRDAAPARGASASGRPAEAGRRGRRGTLYRGREGMWSWVAHRITGVLIFFFLFAHVLDTALVRVSKSSYNTVIDSYKNPVTNFLEYGLTAAIVFHAFNGLRIIAVDFWAKGPRYQRRMLWIVVGVWIALMAGMLYPITAHSWHTIFGK